MAKGRRGRRKTNKWIRHIKRICSPAYRQTKQFKSDRRAVSQIMGY